LKKRSLFFLLTYRTNVAFMGAWIPPGEHTLRLSFAAPLWTLGVSISITSLFAFLLGVGLWLRARWRREDASDSAAKYHPDP